MKEENIPLIKKWTKSVDKRRRNKFQKGKLMFCSLINTKIDSSNTPKLLMSVHFFIGIRTVATSVNNNNLVKFHQVQIIFFL